MKVIALYPGRFQPFGKHHYASFKWLQDKFGDKNTYVVTSNKVSPPKSPLSFKEKKEILQMYGVSHVINTTEPYKLETYPGTFASKYSPKNTVIVFLVGEKDMGNDARFPVTKDSYFQHYEKHKNNLQPYEKHAYLVSGPHISYNIPGIGEMSGTNIRAALSKYTSPIERRKIFLNIFGWYDEDIDKMFLDKFNLNEVDYHGELSKVQSPESADDSIAVIQTMTDDGTFSLSWWGDIFKEVVSEGYPTPKQAAQHTNKIDKLKSFLHQNVGREFVYDFDKYPKTVYGVKIEEDSINEEDPCWDGYKQVGMKKKGNRSVPNCVPVKEYVDEKRGLVKCAICNEWMGQIQYRHLKLKHNGITLAEYKKQYPDYPLIAESRKNIGNKNPMSNPNSVKKIKETKLSKYGNENYNNIQKQQNTIQNKYGVTNIMQLAHNVDRANKQLQEIRDKAYESGRWLSAADKPAYIGYRDRVRNISNQNFKLYRNLFDTTINRNRKWHLDHVYSIFDGYKNNIPENIIGHPCNLRLVHHSINESKNIKSLISINALLNEIKIFEERQLLLCGGAAGHMDHPFNIPGVTNGTDLIEVFRKSVEYLKQKPASVKIDGVNASIRLVKLGNKLQFVMDRGSNKPLDVKGITKSDLQDRFGEGHGMIKVGGTVLDIFNTALPRIKPELVSLGMYNNPNIMFNMEYVEGASNVLSYGKNFLAIHGLLEISQITPTKRATKEVRYNKRTLQKLLNKLDPVANEFGFEVVGSVDTSLEAEPDLDTALAKQYSININNKTITKSLKTWLDNVTIPTKKIKLTNGKTVDALSKEVLVQGMSGIPINEIVLNPDDIESFVNGYFTYVGTMALGDVVLKSLSSKLGNVSEQEGIVIRDKSISSNPFKITGSFIVKGIDSPFRK